MIKEKISRQDIGMSFYIQNTLLRKFKKLEIDTHKKWSF